MKIKHYNNNRDYNILMQYYFDYLKENPNTLSYRGLEELLRYSLCTALGLQTSETSYKVREISFKLIQGFKIKLNELDIYRKSEEYKQGLLEACVHCMKFTLEKVAKGGIYIG